MFGDRFLYSNCKQLTPHGSASALQSLTRGSVIVFGSQIDGRFRLNMVFVVAAAYVAGEISAAEHLQARVTSSR